MKVFLVAATLIGLAHARALGQVPQANYDESRVRAYTLPDALRAASGARVTDAQAWRTVRRPELLELFRREVYGRAPGTPVSARAEVAESDSRALGGLATRRQISIHLGDERDGPRLHLLLYIPNNRRDPVPAFLGINFNGNYAVVADSAIRIDPRWRWNTRTESESLARDDAATRGTEAARWQLRTLIERGYALATLQRADIEPDYATGWRHGVRGYFLKKAGHTEFAADDWGAIGAWAWALSRALDYLETDPSIDAKRVAVIGHSRLGKAALWAGAQDERFALVISNNSGEGGAALARRNFGETVEAITRAFPHWFAGNYRGYAADVDRLPVDQHELLALIAPRPVYVASAADDLWADPLGEFLSARNAEPVYSLFGKAGLGVAESPPVNTPVGDFIGYHRRSGRHDVTLYDWEQYLRFADRHFGIRRDRPD